MELSEKHQNWFVLKAEKLATCSWKNCDDYDSDNVDDYYKCDGGKKN